MSSTSNEHGENQPAKNKVDPWTVNDPAKRLARIRDSRRNAELRAKSYKPSELHRNTPIIRQIVRGFRNNIIGVGVDVDFQNGSKEKRQTLQRKYNRWCKSYFADFHGDTNFGGIQSLVVATMYTHHAAFIVRYVERDNSGVLQLRLRVIGQNWLDQSKGNKGLELDSFGRVEGFYIFNNVDQRSLGSKLYRKDLDVIHCKISDEAEAILGLSDLLTSIKASQDLSDLNDARITQQTIAACMALIVRGIENNETIGIKNLKEMESLTPGMIAYLENTDADITPVTPAAPTGGQETEHSLRRDIAIAAGSNYEIATGDFSRVNFASGRFSRQEFKSQVKVIQSHSVSVWMDKIMQWFYDVEVLNTPSMAEALNQITHSFSFADLESISPKEDLDVDITKVRTGVMSPQDFARKYGSNFELVVDAWREARQLMDDAGVIFDIDGSRVSAAGNIQITENIDPNNPRTATEQQTTESNSSSNDEDD